MEFRASRRPTLVQVPQLVCHGWRCITVEPLLVVNVTNETYVSGEPDEYRLEPDGTLPNDWYRKDG